MNIDNLIVLIIVLIIIAAQLRKLARSGRKPGQQKQSGLKGQLGEIWTRLQRELEAAKAKSAPPSGWEQFMPQPSDQPEDLDFTEDLSEPSHPRPAPSETAQVLDATEPISLADETSGVLAQNIKTPPSVDRGPLTSSRSSTFDSADLEKAVVWSEIIGPPLALRNREEAT